MSFGSAAATVGAHLLFLRATLVLIGLTLVAPEMVLAILLSVAARLTLRPRPEQLTTWLRGMVAVVDPSYASSAFRI